MVKNELKREKYINYIVIFILLYMSSSFYGLAIPGRVNASILLIFSVITFLGNKKSRNINLKTLLFIIFAYISSIVTMLMNSEDVDNYLIFWVYLFVAYIIYLSIDTTEFILIFNNIMFFLAVFSLISFGILLLFPSVYQYVPMITNRVGLRVYNLFFSVARHSNYFNSNFGIFWEPGAYQTFLNLALFFELFIINNFNVKRILVFLVTIITTFSSTGYLAAMLLIFIYIIYDGKFIALRKIMNKRKKMSIMMLTFLIVVAIVFPYLPNNIKFKVFGKLKAIFNPDLVKSNPSYGSTTARINSIVVPIFNFFKSPIYGVGFDNLTNSSINMGSNFLTATPLNWFGLFGLPLGILFNICLWRWTNHVNANKFIKLFIFIFLVIIIISENYNRNSFFLAFLLHGFSSNKSIKSTIYCENHNSLQKIERN